MQPQAEAAIMGENIAWGGGMQYRIRVRGQLESAWEPWLGDMHIVFEPGGEMSLVGDLPDQSALYGVLQQLNRLNTELIYLERVETQPGVSGQGEMSPRDGVTLQLT
jgi:hypothetical protein